MSTNSLFEALASRPDDAVVLRGATSVWTAKAVRDEVERLAVRISGARVVAVLADNSPEWVLTDLAALHAGVVLLPLPGFLAAGAHQAEWADVVDGLRLSAYFLERDLLHGRRAEHLLAARQRMVARIQTLVQPESR